MWAIFIKRHYDVRIAFWIVAFFISLRSAILSETSILVKWLEMHVSQEGWLVFCMNDYKCLSSRTNGITIGNLFLATVPARVGSQLKAQRFPIFLANIMLVKFHICQQQTKMHNQWKLSKWYQQESSNPLSLMYISLLKLTQAMNYEALLFDAHLFRCITTINTLIMTLFIWIVCTRP